MQREVLTQILEAFLFAYALFLIISPNFKLPKNDFFTILGGVLSGFFAGIFGIGGAVRSAFLSAFNLNKAIYIATAGAIALMYTIKPY